jgi:AcrR family transcriptional regulator
MPADTPRADAPRADAPPDKPSRPRTGRARNPQARQAILAATLHLARDNLDDLTVDRIAAAAGVGKQTIYRWWPSKWDVLLEALLDLAEREVRMPGAGPLRADIDIFLTTTFASITHANGTGQLLRALMAHAQLDPSFAVAWRDQFVQPRRAALITLLTTAQARGELRGSDPEVAADLIFGALWYRLLVGHAPLDAEFALQITNLLLGNRT